MGGFLSFAKEKIVSFVERVFTRHYKYLVHNITTYRSTDLHPLHHRNANDFGQSFSKFPTSFLCSTLLKIHRTYATITFFVARFELETIRVQQTNYKSYTFSRVYLSPLANSKFTKRNETKRNKGPQRERLKFEIFERYVVGMDVYYSCIRKNPLNL